MVNSTGSNNPLDASVFLYPGKGAGGVGFLNQTQTGYFNKIRSSKTVQDVDDFEQKEACKTGSSLEYKNRQSKIPKRLRMRGSCQPNST